MEPFFYGFYIVFKVVHFCFKSTGKLGIDYRTTWCYTYSMNTKDKIFYTYGYMSKRGNMYYIGKGKGVRAYEAHKGIVGTPKDRSKIVFFKKDSLHMYAKPQLMLEREALDREIELIKHYGRKDLNEGHLLNLTDGGEGPSGLIFSEESKKKISIAKKGVKLNISPRMRKKISKMRSGENNVNWGKFGKDSSRWGKKHTDETKQKMSIKATGKNNSQWGKKHTDEWKKKRSMWAMPSGKDSPNYKGEVVGTHTITEKVIRFEKTSELKPAGFNKGAVCANIRGENNHHKGYIWTREELNDK